MKKFKARVDKKDRYRALLTDTSTGDIPIIFSNDGMYLNLRSVELNNELVDIERLLLLNLGLIGAGSNMTIPYKYYINNGETKIRALSLIHPSSQIKYSEFYSDNASTINYLCSKSESSLRAPIGVLNSFYIYGQDKIKKYKSSGIELEKSRFYRKYVKSYFYYRGYRIMYKFFDSWQLLALEKKYKHMSLIDISKCFYSIYTHSISWAVKGKEYSKVNAKNGIFQFSLEFDKLIQNSNYKETNGIPVGSEVSRIFAEIILQQIDLNAKSIVSDRYSLKYGDDYEFYRYVDDYIVFVKDEVNMDKIIGSLSDAMREYNLYVNESKVKHFNRPFETEKSAVVTSVKKTLEGYFISHFPVEKGQINFDAKYRMVYFKEIISQLKKDLSQNNADYDDISGLVISMVANKLVGSKSQFIDKLAGVESDTHRRVHIFIRVSLELIAFLFSVSPKVTSSYSLAKIIVLYNEFYEKYLPDFHEDFKTHCQDTLNVKNFISLGRSDLARVSPIEGINVLLAMSKFGEGYLESIATLDAFLERDNTYFTIISLLAYIQDHKKYLRFRLKLEGLILDKCKKNPPDKYSESAHLLLDTLSCPYISESLKLELLNQSVPQLKNPRPKQVYIDAISSMSNKYWFVNWKRLNLIALLQRSRLLTTY
jgi:hypothetical protein